MNFYNSFKNSKLLYQMPIEFFYVVILTSYGYGTLVIFKGARLKLAIVSKVQGTVVLKEHGMSIISFCSTVTELFRKFASTSRFHGPPAARNRSA
ncbi:hypothetical protein FX983_02243 [Pseudomonas frederiksbergensis]|uniref:Uncharacterized protein n=1 Tax=Pseudomonas frederiksbergensis TaxID=104087 RepID=A0A6L5C289_9PSED|nr:hypothetical protein FX983_02243 [Pseudomonas frederiksbergensis]